MKAVRYAEYGSPDVLRLEDVDQPVPADDEILVKVHAVSVNRSDWEGLTGKPPYARLGGLRKPRHRTLGSDVAGRVEAAGRNHLHFRPGDEVLGETESYRGGFAEYVCTRGEAWVLKPPGLTFDQAAAIPQAAVIALQGLRDKGPVQPGHSVLINGGGGGAGTFAIQLAKLYGAAVTAVDNGGKLALMRSLGADHVIDYTRQDFSQNDEQYDLILDLVAQRSAFTCARALKPRGRYYAVGGPAATLLQIVLLGPLIRRTMGKNVGLLLVRRNRADLALVTELCEAGEIVPVIERRYRLSEVPEALRHLGEDRAKGKLVVTVEDASAPSLV